jgi:proteasome alpha subunit
MSGFGNGEAKGAYDGNIVVFSPEGRLYQVEYAREAIRRGSTIIAVKYDKGVVIIADRRVESVLVDVNTIQKIFQIDEHLWIAISGLTADGRALVDLARRVAQGNRVTYEEEIPVRVLAEQLTAHMQSVTHGGNRPYGAGLIITDGKSIYETDPSGTMIGVFATAVGQGRLPAVEHMVADFRLGLDANDAYELAFAAMNKATDGKYAPGMVEMKLLQLF